MDSQSNLIDMQQTNRRLKTQIDTIEKILQSIFWKKINREIIYSISKFYFPSPLKTKGKAYIYNPSNQLLLGSSILVSQQKNIQIPIVICEIWKAYELDENNVKQAMKLADPFCFFLNKSKKEKADTEEKINILSSNTQFFRNLITIVSRFQNEGKIDKFIIKALSQLIKFNMIVIKISNWDPILYIETDHPINLLQKRSHSLYIGYDDNTWKCNSNFQIFSRSSFLRRSKVKLLINHEVIELNDIFPLTYDQ